jgi:hypothetical protein
MVAMDKKKEENDKDKEDEGSHIDDSLFETDNDTLESKEEEALYHWDGTPRKNPMPWQKRASTMPGTDMFDLYPSTPTSDDSQPVRRISSSCQRCFSHVLNDI